MALVIRRGAKRARGYAPAFTFGRGGGGGGGGIPAAAYVPRAPIPYRRRRKGMLSGATTYRFVRSTAESLFSISVDPSGVTQVYGYSINLGQLPNSAEFTALYDQYKITRVKWHFLCSSSDAGVQVDSPGHTEFAINGFLHTVVDKTDVTPEGVDALRQHSSYRVTRLTDLNGTKGCVSYAPKVNMNIAAELGTHQAQSKERLWLDTASASTLPYNGLKFAVSFPPGVISTNLRIQIYAQVWVTFKNTK